MIRIKTLNIIKFCFLTHPKLQPSTIVRVKSFKCDYKIEERVAGRLVEQRSKNFIQIVFNRVFKLRLVKLIGDDGKAFNFYHFQTGKLS